MKNDIAEGDEYDAGEGMREGLRFGEWDRTGVKVTPFTDEREYAR